MLYYLTPLQMRNCEVDTTRHNANAMTRHPAVADSNNSSEHT